MRGAPDGSGDEGYAAIIAKGDALKDDERHQEAAPCYERAFQMRPDSPGPLIKKIDTLLLDARSGDITDDAERLVRLFPGGAKSYEVRGRVRSYYNKHSGAVDDFAAALKLDPDSAETLKGMGYSLIALGRHREAVGMYERAVRLRPGDPDAAYYLCHALEELGRYSDALAVLKAHLAVAGGNDRDVYRHMGRVLGLLGDVEGSFSYYLRSVDLDKPGRGGGRFLFRLYRRITGTHKSLKGLDPSNPLSFYKAGVVMLYEGWTATAINVIETGARLSPNQWAYGVVGDEHMKQTNYTEAIAAYKRALELPDDIPAAHLAVLYGNLIMCLCECGRFREVLEYGKKAISLNLAGREMKEYYRKVLAMGPDPVDEDQVEGGWTTKFDI